jgi:hypothetical protein
MDSTATATTTSNNEMNYNLIDAMLEKEKQHNKSETWNKLDKTIKIQKLHGFAEKYGKQHSIPLKEVKALKSFFVECLEKSKLQKAKDVIYDKEHHEITSIPSLHFNTTTHNFTLKITDAKRVSTLKSLTPKRLSAKNNDAVEVQNIIDMNLQNDFPYGKSGGGIPLKNAVRATCGTDRVLEVNNTKKDV